jgi:bifunctional NMN adenylyltransferase/nudix hydrolase
MQEKQPTAEVGVIIGRFQVPDLHPGHKELLREVSSRHKRVLILIGSTPAVKVTRRNPLDYHTRMFMIREECPNAIIAPIIDMPSDQDWSNRVDGVIADHFDFETTALLYGSRDGFAPHYCGKHQVIELQPKYQISGSDIRKSVSDEVRRHSEFRRGCVYAAWNRHKTVFNTVDIGICRFNVEQVGDGGPYTEDFVILGRKKTDPESRWRFPGGFLNP